MTCLQYLVLCQPNMNLILRTRVRSMWIEFHDIVKTEADKLVVPD